MSTAGFYSGILGAFAAVVDEHKRCGELNGGTDNGYVWMDCTCAALIMHPASDPPRVSATGQSSPPDHYSGRR